MVWFVESSGVAEAEHLAVESPGEGGQVLDALDRSRQVDEQVAAAAGLRNAGDAAMVDLVAEVLEDGSWQGWGIHSPTHWVGWKFGLTRGRARQVVTLARRLDELPHLAKTFGECRLSFEQAHCVARYCPIGFDDDVALFATHATMHQLKQTLSRYGFDAEAMPDADDAGEGAKKLKNRASKGFGDDGRYRLSLDVDAALGGGVDAAVEQAWARLKADVDLTDEVGLADAIVDCFSLSAAADPSDARKANNALMVHIDIDRLLESNTPGLVGRLHLGPVLDPSLAELLTCEANSQLVIRSHGRPINLGRSTAVIPRWLRRLVQARDGGCRFCGSIINLDVHHIVHWAHGGPTDEVNLVTLCSRHHHATHSNEFRIVGDPSLTDVAGMTGPDRLRFLNPHGVDIGRAPQPVPPDSPSSARYQPASGERLQPWAVWFNPN